MADHLPPSLGWARCHALPCHHMREDPFDAAVLPGAPVWESKGQEGRFEERRGDEGRAWLVCWLAVRSGRRPSVEGASGCLLGGGHVRPPTSN